MSELVTLVTGTGGAIGRATARRLRADGHNVVTMGHTPGADIVVDFTDDEALARAVDGLPEIRAMALCHGYLEPGPAKDVPIARFRAMLDVNLMSMYNIVHTSLDHLSAGAAIVIVSSTAAFDHSPVGGPHYTVGKWGLNGLVRHLSEELGARSIRINSICPGLIDNPMGRVFLTPERYDADAAGIPLGRAGTDDECAAAISFLVSDESSYITGALLPVSGGYK
jgi:NAD(P)-dependent dehydrogenase (short-subunit alcohol dehydrogenase family)